VKVGDLVLRCTPYRSTYGDVGIVIKIHVFTIASQDQGIAEIMWSRSHKSEYHSGGALAVIES
jgi:hypothetical protein